MKEKMEIEELKGMVYMTFELDGYIYSNDGDEAIVDLSLTRNGSIWIEIPNPYYPSENWYPFFSTQGKRYLPMFEDFEFYPDSCEIKEYNHFGCIDKYLEVHGKFVGFWADDDLPDKVEGEFVLRVRSNNQIQEKFLKLLANSRRKE